MCKEILLFEGKEISLISLLNGHCPEWKGCKHIFVSTAVHDRLLPFLDDSKLGMILLLFSFDIVTSFSMNLV